MSRKKNKNFHTSGYEMHRIVEIKYEKKRFFLKKTYESGYDKTILRKKLFFLQKYIDLSKKNLENKIITCTCR